MCKADNVGILLCRYCGSDGRGDSVCTPHRGPGWVRRLFWLGPYDVDTARQVMGYKGWRVLDSWKRLDDADLHL